MSIFKRGREGARLRTGRPDREMLNTVCPVPCPSFKKSLVLLLIMSLCVHVGLVLRPTMFVPPGWVCLVTAWLWCAVLCRVVFRNDWQWLMNTRPRRTPTKLACGEISSNSFVGSGKLLFSLGSCASGSSCTGLRMTPLYS